MESKKQHNYVTMEDHRLVAWLMLKGHRIVPRPKDGYPGRVCFDCYGDVDASLQEFYDDALVSVQAYARAINNVNGTINAHRNMRIHGE